MNTKTLPTEYGRFETLNYWVDNFPALEVSSNARLVWLILWRHADELGVVDISFRRLSQDTGLSLRGCQNFIKELIDKGVLKKVKRGNFRGSRNKYAFPVKRKNGRKKARSP